MPEKKRKRASNRYWREIKGNLYARLQYKDESGKRREKLKRIADKRTARTVVEEMRRELKTHGEELFQSEKMTFERFAQIYKKSKLTPAVFENGIKISGRKSNVDWALNALIDFFGSKRLQKIKVKDIENYKHVRLNETTRLGTKRKISTVNRELSVLRTMFNFALQNDWIIQNPFSKAKGLIAVSAETERDRVLSPEEEQRLLDACVDKRAHLKPILICALDTAMRRGEIFKLQWKDVNFTSNEIYISQTNTKTEDSRIVGITSRLREELVNLWEVSPKDEDTLVFGITNTIQNSFRTASRIADIKDFRFHDCRHTATTRMIAAGSPHTEVMKITGHTQIKTFLRYLNITPETANRVADRLNGYLVNNELASESTQPS